MYTGTLINEVMAAVERVQAQTCAHRMVENEDTELRVETQMLVPVPLPIRLLPKYVPLMRLQPSAQIFQGVA